MGTDIQLLLNALLVLIPVSAGIRIILCLLKINTDPDQAATYKTRIKNILLYTVVAETASGVLTLVYSYLS